MTYRILVTGSREFDRADLIDEQLCTEHGRWWREAPVLVHGDCPTGADAIADFVWVRGVGRDSERHPADWGTHGKVAGLRRNQEMVDLGADICLAFYQIGAGNKGTDHCAGRAEAAGIPVRRIWSDGTIVEPGTWPGLRNFLLAHTP